MPHRTHRADTTQEKIVAALRKVGAGIIPLSLTIKGVPDLLVSLNTPEGPTTLLMEVKGPKTRVQVSQLLFHQTWPGRVVVVRTVAEALAAVGIEEVGA